MASLKIIIWELIPNKTVNKNLANQEKKNSLEQLSFIYKEEEVKTDKNVINS